MTDRTQPEASEPVTTVAAHNEKPRTGRRRHECVRRQPEVEPQVKHQVRIAFGQSRHRFGEDQAVRLIGHHRPVDHGALFGPRGRRAPAVQRRQPLAQAVRLIRGECHGGEGCLGTVHPDDDAGAALFLPLGHDDDGTAGVSRDLRGLGAEDIVPKPAQGVRVHNEELRADCPVGEGPGGRALEDRRAKSQVRSDTAGLLALTGEQQFGLLAGRVQKPDRGRAEGRVDDVHQLDLQAPGTRIVDRPLQRSPSRRPTADPHYNTVVHDDLLSSPAQRAERGLRCRATIRQNRAESPGVGQDVSSRTRRTVANPGRRPSTRLGPRPCRPGPYGGECPPSPAPAALTVRNRQ